MIEQKHSFSDDVDTYDARVYEKAASMLKEWIEDGSFIRDEVKDITFTNLQWMDEHKQVLLHVHRLMIM